MEMVNGILGLKKWVRTVRIDGSRDIVVLYRWSSLSVMGLEVLLGGDERV